MRHVIDRIVAPLGRRIDESSPLVDARLPDGSRVNAIIPPLALGGPVLTIRKFSRQPFTLDRLVELKTLRPDMATYLERCVRQRVSVLVSGGTGSGKTSTLNALGRVIPPGERLITIEDSAELQLGHPHWIALEARPPNIEGQGEIPIRTLVRNALRMRPDRIIVGEVRGGEAFDMLQAMNTGHRGSMTTLHANSPEDALVRLESMVLMAGFELPVTAIRRMIAGAVQVVVQQDRMPDGRARGDVDRRARALAAGRDRPAASLRSERGCTGRGDEAMKQGRRMGSSPRLALRSGTESPRLPSLTTSNLSRQSPVAGCSLMANC